MSPSVTARGSALRQGELLSSLRQGEAPAAASQLPVPRADLASALLYGLQRELLRLPLEAEGN